MSTTIWGYLTGPPLPFRTLSCRAETSPNMSITHIPQSKLGVSEPPPEWFGNGPNESNNTNWTNKNWLKSRFHFSFAEYNNPRNMSFGVLRVMNDDLVQPLRGFGAHPHRDVEICTYIVDGFLTHKDSMGTAETLGRGAVQFMTAGSGVQHSEHNHDKTNPLRFIQIWITTRTRGLRPNYGSSIGNFEDRKNKFAHLVTDVQNRDSSVPIKINQDANIHVAEIDLNNTVNFNVMNDRQAYLLCMEGSIEVKTKDRTLKLLRHDSAEIKSINVEVTSVENKAHVLIVEMALTRDGRTDL